MKNISQIKEIHLYIERLFSNNSEKLKEIIENSRSGGLPEIQVPPVLGQTLYFLAKLKGCRRILEIGSLGGYSTAHLAMALPADGELVTLEHDPKHAAVTRENLADDPRIKVREGDGLELLLEYPAESFDLIFLDADKQQYPAYLEPMVERLMPGGLLLADNVIRMGKILSPKPHDPHMNALAAFNKALANHPGLLSIVLPTFGGYGGTSLDGLAAAVKK